jgi:hypothetical protein
VERWSRSIPEQALSLQSLRIHLQQPLAEDEKIPISQHQFDRLSYSVRGGTLSAEEVKTLFRVSEDECAVELSVLFEGAIYSVPPASGTEDIFHSTWEDNIGKILRLILPAGEPIRNGNRDSTTELKWPDYGLLFKSHCILRGEENGSETAGNPERELVDKLRWTYQPLPFILGLLWISLLSKAFLCICYRLSCNCHGRPLCCNYPATLDNCAAFQP